MDDIYFVFIKKDIIKVLPFKEGAEKSKNLIANGWSISERVNAREFIQRRLQLDYNASARLKSILDDPANNLTCFVG